ncbi:MAG: hypothetical protein H7831_01690 [Magnetococcus sp. WYHC-3]
MLIIKWLVIGMGGLLVAGMVALGLLIARDDGRSGRLGNGIAESSQQASASAIPPSPPATPAIHQVANSGDPVGLVATADGVAVLTRHPGGGGGQVLWLTREGWERGRTLLQSGDAGLQPAPKRTP